MNSNLEKAMIIGLFISKYDKDGLNELGFKNFTEAFNVIGLSINVKPSSIKNYKDEFDPYFPNNRVGWKNREMYPSRQIVLSKYQNISRRDFVKIVKNIIYKSSNIDSSFNDIFYDNDANSTFAKRLITGQAAENYFKNNYECVDLFRNTKIEDTTMYGCGFDFKLNSDKGFYAIEVKGLANNNGNISLTEKECFVAEQLKDNYFIFLVKNFIKKPYYEVYRNPLKSNKLNFVKQEKIVTQINWNSYV